MNNLLHDSYLNNDKIPNVLFVDDEIKIRKGINRLFQQFQVPWTYSLADGVDEALEILQEQEVDAVVSDLRMPDRDGLELLSFLRNNPLWSDLPVIILTGIGNPALKSQALDMGATDLLSKPVNPDELLARIRSALHIKKCQDIIKMQGAHLDELVLQRTETIAAIQLDLVWRLGNAAEFRSNETNHHVVRVGHYSKIIAEKLGMEKDFIDLIFLASPLHDLGKITVPESILLKNGPLTYEEWKIMKTHSRNGQEMLNTKTFAQAPTGRALNEILHKEGNTFLDMAADIAGAHHEQWNGSGYPHGKRQEEIPLSARIVIISDVYDALRSNRTYRLGIGPGETLELMRLENNCRFDPDIFAIFEQSLADFQDIHHQYRDVGNKRMDGVTSFHRIT